MKKVFFTVAVLGTMGLAQASQAAHVYQCAAQNFRGFTFYGVGFLKPMAKLRALENCQNSRLTLDPRTCRIISCR